LRGGRGHFTCWVTAIHLDWRCTISAGT